MGHAEPQGGSRIPQLPPMVRCETSRRSSGGPIRAGAEPRRVLKRPRRELRAPVGVHYESVAVVAALGGHPERVLSTSAVDWVLSIAQLATSRENVSSTTQQ
jgi:hypothetical protein